MIKERSPVEIHSLQKLKETIKEYLDTHKLGAAIRTSAEILSTHNGQKINCLSGQCVGHTNELNRYLEARGIPNTIVKSKNNQVHTFLKCQTTEGEIIIDPSLGQFINYPNIFVGTLAELRAVFLSPEREFLGGTKLWAVEHDITSREEWFDILYEN